VNDWGVWNNTVPSPTARNVNWGHSRVSGRDKFICHDRFPRKIVALLLLSQSWLLPSQICDVCPLIRRSWQARWSIDFSPGSWVSVPPRSYKRVYLPRLNNSPNTLIVPEAVSGAGRRIRHCHLSAYAAHRQTRQRQRDFGALITRGIETIWINVLIDAKEWRNRAFTACTALPHFRPPIVISVNPCTAARFVVLLVAVLLRGSWDLARTKNNGFNSLSPRDDFVAAEKPQS